jgi:hypothetical protein
MLCQYLNGLSFLDWRSISKNAWILCSMVIELLAPHLWINLLSSSDARWIESIAVERIQEIRKFCQVTLKLTNHLDEPSNKWTAQMMDVLPSDLVDWKSDHNLEWSQPYIHEEIQLCAVDFIRCYNELGGRQDREKVLAPSRVKLLIFGTGISIYIKGILMNHCIYENNEIHVSGVGIK